MIELLSNLFFALETLKEDGIALHLRMRNLNGDGLARAEIRALEDGSHTAPGNQAFNPEMVELFASVSSNHLLDCHLCANRVPVLQCRR
jgi:hypothetical protein